MLTLKYERKDFFNQRIYTEDSMKKYDKSDVKKVLLYFNKDYYSSVQIENTVIFWDSMAEHENKIVTVRLYDGMNYTENKCSFEKLKKDIYSNIE